jgi:hypothetical protein
MNEGIVQEGQRVHSYHNLRKAFKCQPTKMRMPVCILLLPPDTRQKNTLIYNTETVGVQPGEKAGIYYSFRMNLPKLIKILIDEFIFQPG